MPLKVALRIGIGDIICSRLILEGTDAEVCLDSRLLKYKDENKEAYLAFANEFAEFIFEGIKFHRTDSSEFRAVGWEDLYMEGHRPKVGPWIDKLCIPHEAGDYICLFTKCRGFVAQDAEIFVDQLIPILNKLDCPIMVIGEREVEMNAEYRLNKVCSIYPFLKERIHRMVDMTIPALGLTVPTLRQFREDCCNIRRSKGVVNIGLGGNLVMSMLFDKAVTLIPKYDYWTEITASVWPTIFPNSFFTVDSKLFLDRVAKL